MAIPYQMPIFGVSPSGQPVQTRYYPQFMHPLPTNRPPVASVRQYPSPAVQDRWNGDAQLPKGYGRILGRMSGPSENEWKNSSEKALTKGFGR